MRHEQKADGWDSNLLRTWMNGLAHLSASCEPGAPFFRALCERSGGRGSSPPAGAKPPEHTLTIPPLYKEGLVREGACRDGRPRPSRPSKARLDCHAQSSSPVRQQETPNQDLLPRRTPPRKEVSRPRHHHRIQRHHSHPARLPLPHRPRCQPDCYNPMKSSPRSAAGHCPLATGHCFPVTMNP